MKSSRTALITHLQSANFTGKAQTIKKYAGELTDRDKRTLTLRIHLPAVLVLFMDGFPLRDVPEHIFSLLFITETRMLDREETEADAITLLGDYAAWLKENYRWQDEYHWYQVVEEGQAQASLLMNDHKYTIAELPVRIRKGV